MKQLITKSVGLALGVVLVAPLLMAPAAVNGSLGGFSGNSPGGQKASDWGIPQNNSNQNSQSSDGGNQSGPGEGQPKSGDGSNQNGSNQNSSNQNSQSGDGQPKSGDGGNQSGPAEGQPKSGDGGNQSGPGEGQPKSGDGGNQNGDGGNQNNDGGNQNGAGEGQPKSGDGGNQNNSGSAEGEGPMLNPMGGSIRPDDPRLGGNQDGGNSSGHGSGSGSGSHGAHSGQGGPGDYPPLDPPNDGRYDPSNNNDGNQVPSGCAEAGSMCAQCVQRNEGVVQFNRRYLHVAWSTTHQAIEYANKAMAFGDAASGIHSTQALAWQLAGKPQITEAVTSLRRTYDNKYNIYINNIEEALNAMNQCEQDNFAVRDLYTRFSSLYLEFVKARYQSPD